MSLPDHLVDLKNEALRTSCEGWAIQKRWTLSKGRDRSGPCPKCGGTDRFSINTVKNLFNCRGCGISGEGVIKLVMATEGLEFVPACEVITGRKAEAPIDPQRAAENARALAEKKRRDDEIAAKYRADARKAGHAIYFQTGKCPADDGPVLEYLRRRAISFDGHPALHSRVELLIRERLDLPYVESNGRNGYETLHSGPAMLWPIRLPARMIQPGDPLGHFGGVHMTWIDLDQPKGKLVLFDPDRRDDKPLPPKKMRGSKQGGMIPLFTPDRPRRIVMGEGCETTLTPFCHAFEPGTAYWAAGDVGNMAGKAAHVDGKRREDLPDMSVAWEGFVVPDWCEELVYLGENDEVDDDAPTKVKAKALDQCRRGLLRNRWLRELARRDRPELPPLRTLLVRPDGGLSDLNDVAMDELQLAGARREKPGEAADQPAGARHDDGGTTGAP